MVSTCSVFESLRNMKEVYDNNEDLKDASILKAIYDKTHVHLRVCDRPHCKFTADMIAATNEGVNR